MATVPLTSFTAFGAPGITKKDSGHGPDTPGLPEVMSPQAPHPPAPIRAPGPLAVEEPRRLVQLKHGRSTPASISGDSDLDSCGDAHQCSSPGAGSPVPPSAAPAPTRKHMKVKDEEPIRAHSAPDGPEPVTTSLLPSGPTPSPGEWEWLDGELQRCDGIGTPAEPPPALPGVPLSLFPSTALYALPATSTADEAAASVPDAPLLPVCVPVRHMTVHQGQPVWRTCCNTVARGPRRRGVCVRFCVQREVVPPFPFPLAS